MLIRTYALKERGDSKMTKKSLKRYRIYEYIRDNCNITENMSNTKRLMIKLMEKDKETEEYCNKKILEEKREVEEAMIGKHFHKNMTKREILVNEISQYIYWLTIIAVSKKVRYEEFNEESKINEILEKVDISKIGETQPITVNEIISHDLESMEQKDYLKGVM